MVLQEDWILAKSRISLKPGKEALELLHDAYAMLAEIYLLVQ